MSNYSLNFPTDNSDNIGLFFIAAANEQEIQVFLEDCSDFTWLESGRPTQPGDGYKLLADRPPGTTQDQKLVYFIEQHGERVGLIELIANYPEERIWWIGLLLIRPKFRGKALGKHIVDILGRALVVPKASEIRLGVLENNQAAYRFWINNGFKKLFSKPDQVFGYKTHTVHVLGKIVLN